MKKQTVINMLVAMGLAVASTSTQAAENYNAGFIATEEGKFSQAVQEYLEPAEKGDANAQFNLGLMYHGGLGVSMSEEEAVRWYHKAAENGNVQAQQFLAAGYGEGWFGLPKNQKKAEYWQARVESAY